MGEEEIGFVTRYFSKIGVAAIKLKSSLKTGSKIRITGATTNFEQIVESMQIDRNKIEEASTGQEIAIKMKDRVRENDKIFLID